MLVALQFWSLRDSSTSMSPLGKAPMGPLCGSLDPTFLLSIALVSALCGSSAPVASLCLGFQVVCSILSNLGGGSHASIALALCMPAEIASQGCHQDIPLVPFGVVAQAILMPT